MSFPTRFPQSLSHSLLAPAVIAAAVGGLAPAARGQITVGSDGAAAVDSTAYSGAQSLEKVGTNTVSLTGSSTYTGGTTVTTGTLSIGAGGTSGSITGDATVATGATLAFDRSDATTFSGVLSGGGNFLKLGGDTLTLTGANSATAGAVASNFSVRNGTLQLQPTANSLLGGRMNIGTVSGDRALVVLNTTATQTIGTFAGDLNDDIQPGVASGSAGVFRHEAGTLRYGGSLYGYITLGAAGAYGGYVLTGGTIANAGTANNNMTVGNGGVGVFEQTGGEANFTRAILLGHAGAAQGLVHLSGGTFRSGTIINDFAIGRNAEGVINLGDLTGGSATLEVRRGMMFCQFSAATGQANFNSGTAIFSTNQSTLLGMWENNTAGTSRVALNGATLQIATNGLKLIDSSIDEVLVFNGGANIDTAGFDASIAAALEAPAGNGIYRNTAFTGTPTGAVGAGYLAAPVVNVSGGSGTGAEVKARVDAVSGTITDFVMTNPGQNYQVGDTLTLTLAGGAATTAAAPYTYVLQASDVAANGAGGLIKSGAGTLTLTGANTYTGPTAVNAGRVLVDGSLANTATTVTSGTLGGIGSIAGGVTVTSGTLAAGNVATPIESLAVGATTLGAGATLGFEVDSTNLGSLGSAADLLVVNGNLSIASGSILDFTDIASSAQTFPDATTFAVINYAGTWDGGLLSYGGASLANGDRFQALGQEWQIDYASSTGGVNFTGDYVSGSFVTLSAVPEPATLGLAAVGIAGAGFAFRRRQLARRRSQAAAS